MSLNPFGVSCQHFYLAISFYLRVFYFSFLLVVSCSILLKVTTGGWFSYLQSIAQKFFCCLIFSFSNFTSHQISKKIHSPLTLCECFKKLRTRPPSIGFKFHLTPPPPAISDCRHLWYPVPNMLHCYVLTKRQNIICMPGHKIHLFRKYNLFIVVVFCRDEIEFILIYKLQHQIENFK